MAATAQTIFTEDRRAVGLLTKPVTDIGATSPRVHNRPWYSDADFRFATKVMGRRVKCL